MTNAYDDTVTRLRRVALVLAAAAAWLGYVWVAAVRAVPRVRERKAAARAARRG